MPDYKDWTRAELEKRQAELAEAREALKAEMSEVNAALGKHIYVENLLATSGLTPEQLAAAGSMVVEVGLLDARTEAPEQDK